MVMRNELIYLDRHRRPSTSERKHSERKRKARPRHVLASTERFKRALQLTTNILKQQEGALKKHNRGAAHNYIRVSNASGHVMPGPEHSSQQYPERNENTCTILYLLLRLRPAPCQLYYCHTLSHALMLRSLWSKNEHLFVSKGLSYG